MSSRTESGAPAASLAALERTLTVSPGDDCAWREYESLVCSIHGPRLAEGPWLTRQYIHCLRADRSDPSPFKELSGYYRHRGQTFNGALCSLAALARDIADDESFAQVLADYDAGIMTPPPFRATEAEQYAVSVILATQNRPATLLNAIESVMAQTMRDFELLVINDGGNDEAERIVASMKSRRIRYLWKQQGGHRSAMNAGLRMARGKYIAYLDDDDVYFPNHLDTVLNAAETGGQKFVCSRNRWVTGHCQGRQWHEVEDLTGYEPFRTERLHASAVIADLNVLHRRSLAERVGAFWEEPPRGGEWEYWVRCSHEVPIRRLDAITGEVRVRSVLPPAQPARAAFFAQLWRNYFGSAFGRALVAGAAVLHGDEAVFSRMAAGAPSQWLFLNEGAMNALATACGTSRSPAAADIWGRIAKVSPVWLLNHLRDTPHRRQVISCLPAAALFRIAAHPFRHPVRAVRKITGKGKQAR